MGMPYLKRPVQLKVSSNLMLFQVSLAVIVVSTSWICLSKLAS